MHIDKMIMKKYMTALYIQIVDKNNNATTIYIYIM